MSVSTDYGDTWTKSNAGLPDKGVISIVMDPNSPVGNRTLYCSVWINGVYKSTDDGQTWEKASDGLVIPSILSTCTRARLVLHEDGTLFALLDRPQDRQQLLHREGPGPVSLHRRGQDLGTHQQERVPALADGLHGGSGGQQNHLHGTNSAKDVDQGGWMHDRRRREMVVRGPRSGESTSGPISTPSEKAGIYMTCFNRGELRKLAASKMANEAPNQTLQPTALVHEAGSAGRQ